MSLNWDTTKVKYFNEHKDELWTKYNEGTVEEYEDVNAETKALIFGTMAVGIGDLKISNAADFYARWKILEHYDKLYLYSRFSYDEAGNCESDLEYTYLTPNVLIKHIGLSTNVNNVSRTEWIKRYVRNRANDRHATERPNLKVVTQMYTSFLREFEESF